MNCASEYVPVLELSETAVRGICMECKGEYAGKLGLHFVNCDGIVGIEILVCCTDKMHVLGRAPISLVPWAQD